jgi:hypothetical protein
VSKRHKIRIESNGRCGVEGDTRVFIDGQDVTSSVTHVTWSLGTDSLSRATLTFTGAEVSVDFIADRSGPEPTLKRDEERTIVSGAYFEKLVADLDAPDEPNERVRKAARRLRDVVRRAGNAAESIPERERLVHDNPALAQQICEGVEEAKAGRAVSLGSFAQYLDDEGEEPGA